MTDRRLIGGEDSIGLEPANVMGVMTLDGLTTNQTRRETFSSEMLVEWAKAVHEAYDGPVEVVFTPNRPVVAVKDMKDGDPSLGIALAPRVMDE